jgi:hypothetical protein
MQNAANPLDTIFIGSAAGFDVKDSVILYIKPTREAYCWRRMNELQVGSTRGMSKFVSFLSPIDSVRTTFLYYHTEMTGNFCTKQEEIMNMGGPFDAQRFVAQAKHANCTCSTT